MIDSYAIVFEAKSGKISNSARQGSKKRIKRDSDNLILGSSNQANRFIAFLKENNDIVCLKDINGITFHIDLTRVRNYLACCVSLDSHSYIFKDSAAVLVATNIINENSLLIPFISLFELEILFDLLETTCEKIHYLFCRGELRENHQYISASEKDLMVAYLDTSFNFFSDSKGIPLEFINNGYSIDQYYEGITKKKPQKKIAPIWRVLINHLENIDLPERYEIGFKLLDFSIENQYEFQDGLKSMFKDLESYSEKEERISKMILDNGEKIRKELLICFTYKNIQVSEEVFINSALQDMQEKNYSESILICYDASDVSSISLKCYLLKDEYFRI